jgi:hypothetical protein
VENGVSKLLIHFMHYLTNAPDKKAFQMPAFVLLAICNLALTKECRVVIDLLEGTRLVYEIMNTYQNEESVLEYGCHCIANLNWPSTEITGNLCSKVVGLLIDIMADPNTSDLVIRADLNALRNLTCDVIEITEQVATKKALKSFSWLMHKHYNIITQLRVELRQLQNMNAGQQQIQILQHEINECRATLFGICSLLWNISENDSIRTRIYDTCYSMLIFVARTFDAYFDIDIAYFILMALANLACNTTILNNHHKECTAIANLLLFNLEKRMDPSLKIKTEWGAFIALHALMQYDPDSSEYHKHVASAVGIWSMFAFTNLTFRSKYMY